MTMQEAVKILMMSPFYFQMNTIARKNLVKEFCNRYNNNFPPN